MNLRHTLEQATGLVLDTASIERAVRERMARTGMVLRGDYAPAPGSAEFDALVDLLVVPESWMFRDPAVFEAALDAVRARLEAAPGRQVRILSLPCAGGEEPYSMAMALLDAGIQPQQCRIDAVDLSAASIARARAGRYGKNAFRSADLGFRARHFVQDEDGEWTIGAAPRAYVGFAQASLFAPGALGPAGSYDLVFCRNLLIYFDAPTGARAAAVLRTLLVADGVLLSGYAEAPTFCRHGFAVAAPNRPFALVKAAARPAARVRPPLRAPAPAAAVPAAAVPAAFAAFGAGTVPPARTSLPPRAETAVPRARTNTEELLARAQRHADGGSLDQAENACRDVLARVPAHAGAWFLLGMIHECAGDLRTAERSWRRCVYLDPDHYEALCALALLHERMGDGAQGADLRRRAARIYERRGRSAS